MHKARNHRRINGRPEAPSESRQPRRCAGRNASQELAMLENKARSRLSAPYGSDRPIARRLPLSKQRQVVRNYLVLLRVRVWRVHL